MTLRMILSLKRKMLKKETLESTREVTGQNKSTPGQTKLWRRSMRQT